MSADQKVAVVTGASQGIGAELVWAFGVKSLESRVESQWLACPRRAVGMALGIYVELGAQKRGGRFRK